MKKKIVARRALTSSDVRELKSLARKDRRCENNQGIEADYSRNKNEGIAVRRLVGVAIGGGLGRSCIGLSAAASKCFSTARGFGLTFVRGSRYVVSL